MSSRPAPTQALRLPSLAANLSATGRSCAGRNRPPRALVPPSLLREVPRPPKSQIPRPKAQDAAGPTRATYRPHQKSALPSEQGTRAQGHEAGGSSQSARREASPERRSAYRLGLGARGVRALPQCAVAPTCPPRHAAPRRAGTMARRDGPARTHRPLHPCTPVCGMPYIICAVCRMRARPRIPGFQPRTAARSRVHGRAGPEAAAASGRPAGRQPGRQHAAAAIRVSIAARVRAGLIAER